MAAPYPPQGNQALRTERPLQIYAEQYLSGQPLPIGVVTTALEPAYVEGDARVYTATGAIPVHETDWILSNRYTGKPIEVISAEEFAERFGPSTELET